MLKLSGSPRSYDDGVRPEVYFKEMIGPMIVEIRWSEVINRQQMGRQAAASISSR
jgi:hypothetical protein